MSKDCKPTRVAAGMKDGPPRKKHGLLGSIGIAVNDVARNIPKQAHNLKEFGGTSVDHFKQDARDATDRATGWAEWIFFGGIALVAYFLFEPSARARLPSVPVIV